MQGGKVPDSRLTFIVPIFKTEAHLPKCLKSLAVQSLKEFDVVLVLDGPSAEAREIISKELKDVKHLVVEIQHGGASKARNIGAKYAKAPYWVFFDSDCVIEPEAAQGWVDALDEDPSIGFVYAGYKWFDDSMTPYMSERFDPWLLRVNNYISTNFPFRKEHFPGWNESLKSLQDWDFWLSIVEKGVKGLYLDGFSWSTAAPTKDSISGQGCSQENWLERIDAVKKLHNIPIKDVCVSSLSSRNEGIRLAKLLDADYRDFPTRMPHHYKKIIQVGFGFHHGIVEQHCSIFSDKSCKNYLFWTKEAIAEAWTRVSRKALIEYSTRLNAICTQFVEDVESERILKLCGFNVQVLPLPFETVEVSPMPEKPKFLVAISGHYEALFNALALSAPDIEFEGVGGAQKLEDYTGLITFTRDEQTVSNGIRRALLNGRYVVSNVQHEFCGYISDYQPPDTFIPKMVEELRSLAKKGPNLIGRECHIEKTKKDHLVEALQ